jgi:oligoendopeptidase F
MTRIVAALVVVLAGTQPVRAVAQGTPAPDLRLSPTLYFPDSLAERSSRAALHSGIDSLVRAIANADEGGLLRQLRVADQTVVALQRHAGYFKVRTLENSADRQAKDTYASIVADLSVIRSAITTRLKRLPPSRIASLGAHARLASDVQSGSHGLTPEADQYRAAVTLPAQQAIDDAYNALMAALPRIRIAASADVATRREGFARRTAVFDSVAPITATLLATLIDLQNRDAAAYGFRNAAVRKYASLGLTDTLVDQTLAAVAAEAPAYRRYQQILAEHAAKRLGIAPVLAAEVNLGLAPAAPIAFDQGRTIILDALAPLGADYVRRFAALLDPANGRLDLAGGLNRVNTGTSIVVYDAPVALYVSSYTGTLANLGVVAHEGGHAIHRELMNTRDSLPVYQRNGPHSLFEGYAIFDEWLVFDRAAKAAASPADREHALETLLSSMATEIFTSAEETALEKNLYTSASGHALLDRARIDDTYRAAIAPYEYWPMSEVGTSRGWISKTLLFHDPLYLVNYLYAGFVAAALYDRAQVDPDFGPKYSALLRRGFDADPKVLLASVGIQLDDPGLIRRAIALFKAKTEELQALYAMPPGS